LCGGQQDGGENAKSILDQVGGARDGCKGTLTGKNRGRTADTQEENTTHAAGGGSQGSRTITKQGKGTTHFIKGGKKGPPNKKKPRNATTTKREVLGEKKNGGP